MRATRIPEGLGHALDPEEQRVLLAGEERRAPPGEVVEAELHPEVALRPFLAHLGGHPPVQAPPDVQPILITWKQSPL